MIMKAKTKKQLSVENKLQKFVIGTLITVFALSALLVCGRVVLAATDSGLEKKLTDAVIINALENPGSEMALVLAKYILVSEQAALANLEETVGDQREMMGAVNEDANVVRTERVCYRYSDSEYTFLCEGWGDLDITIATTTVAEQNLMGVDAYIDYVEPTMFGTVSSSWDLFVGVATSSFVDYDAGTGGLHARPDNLIDGYQFVTTTVPMEHPYTLDGYRNTINSINDAGTLGLNTVPFTSSTWIVAFRQYSASSTDAVCTGAYAGVSCEAVTSTVNGVTSGKIRYKYHYEIEL